MVPSLPLAAVLGAAALAAGGLALFAFAPSARHAQSGRSTIHAAPVSFRYPTRGPDSGDIVATVTDPFAAQSALNAAFQAAGLDIVVTLVPASPSAVGTVVEISEPANAPQIATLTGGSCVTGGGGVGGCPIGVTIPRDFTGQGSITLGRPAKPGERYVSTNDAFAPGELLHCSGLLNAPVSQAQPTLAADGITAYWGSFPTAGQGSGDQTPPAGSEYVVDADPVSAGTVWLRTSAQPLSGAPLQLAQQQYDQGC
jgi:hypothetical protein